MGDDGHIHVDIRVPGSNAAVRNLLAGTFGLAADLPSTVTTGCRQRVPFAMTSPRPDRVTCLPCREYAQRQHLRFAERLEHLAALPGSPVTPAQAARAAARHREIASRFGRP
ncbi:hypothetical protein [Streptomyces mangrovisoli]|uniref:Uncharacterized protein n=1 Tax=Streptomyces mangrovisoli TaxID=1428628 RepID=A0A1J4P2W1_9ACTN|nr:hypothetical protein [Streptomyces mangrovisoli]OIJ68554.1 hypothetical protein WN71_007115 [Streptomyces mangrovisoli]